MHNSIFFNMLGLIKEGGSDVSERSIKNPPEVLSSGGYQVRKKGLEPPRLAAPDPKSGAATNYATSALGFL